MTTSPKLELGCGLIRIGRTWGVEAKPVPSEQEALAFLEFAFTLGIRFFDTAPAYGLSEARLGLFLKNLTPQQRRQVTVATKFGEHWSADAQEPYTDHNYSALARSLERSLNFLGSIQLLQLHKATEMLLQSSEVARALQDAQQAGVWKLGVSISDIGTGLAAVSDARFSSLQLPVNQDREDLLPVIEAARTAGKEILANRPFVMGGLFVSGESDEQKAEKMRQAYQYIHDLSFGGVVLTGTANKAHLQENYAAFSSGQNNQGGL